MTDQEDGMHGELVRVLVVDDEPAICKALTIALQRAGYDALSAQSGDSALALLANEHVDILLIDLRIPDTRGDVVFELAAATHPHLRHQTLFMTGDISAEAERAIAATNCPYLRKPFDMTLAVQAIYARAERSITTESTHVRHVDSDGARP